MLHASLNRYGVDTAYDRRGPPTPGRAAEDAAQAASRELKTRAEACSVAAVLNPPHDWEGS